MKIRFGFFSNSSSSSFCIFGLSIDDIEELNFEGIEGFYGEDDGLYYIGSSLVCCGDDETMGDFKRKIMEKIRSKAKETIGDIEFDFFEGSTYR